MRILTIKRLWVLQWTLLAGAIAALWNPWDRRWWPFAYIGLILSAAAANSYRKRLVAQQDDENAEALATELANFFPDLENEINEQIAEGRHKHN